MKRAKDSKRNSKRSLFRVEEPGDLLEGITEFFKMPETLVQEIRESKLKFDDNDKTHPKSDATMIDFHQQKKNPWTMITNSILNQDNPRNKILLEEVEKLKAIKNRLVKKKSRKMRLKKN